VNIFTGSRPGFNHIAAAAGRSNFFVFWMDFGFHLEQPCYLKVANDTRTLSNDKDWVD